MDQLPLINLCIHPGCENKARNKIKRGYCLRHYTRLYRHGNSEIYDIRKNAKGLYSSLFVVDRGTTRYWATGNGKNVKYIHRFLGEIILGRKLHTHEHIHHKDGNGLNNRIENLEVLFAEKHNYLSSQRRWNKDKEPF